GRAGCLHRGQGGEAPPRVADRSRLADHGLGEATSQACAACGRVNVETLHLAEAAAQRPHRHTAAWLDAVGCEEQTAGRRGVGPGECCDLLGEALERELDA